MRITGGKARGIQLSAPKGRATRPATDQMRESVFSYLGAGLKGARVADCFAGTGAYGLEALSRGARGGLFVENSPEVVSCLQANLAAVAKSCELKTIEAWQILPQKVYALNHRHGPFDLIFLDPPYAMIESKIVAIFSENITPIAAPNARICLELPGDLELTFPDWECLRRLGKSGKDRPSVAVYQRKKTTAQS